MQRIDYTQNETAKQGRNGDKYMAHVTDDEMIVPANLLSPEIIEQLRAEMIALGINPDEYTVGGEMSINPETGLPEFFLKKAFKKVSKLVNKVVKIIPGGNILAPIAASYALPGLGSYLGGALGLGTTAGTALAGAGLGGLTGGDFRSALLGGVSGALAPNLGDIGSYASKQLGSVGDSLSGYFNNSAAGRIFNDASGALGAGFNDVSNAFGKAYDGSALQDIYSSGRDALSSIGIGSSESSVGTGAVGGGGSSYLGSNPSLPNFGQDTVRGSASSLLGSVPPQISDLSDITGVADVAGKNRYLSPLVNFGVGAFTNASAQDDLLEAARKNQELISPYLNFSFDGADLQNDPGYQFNLQQGNQALDRAQLARGGYFSGEALKAAQDYGQGLADNTYNQAFNRALQSNNAGLNAALQSANINNSKGNVKATSAINTGNLLSGSLADILGGNAYSNSGALMGGRDNNDILYRLLGLA